MIKDLEAEHFSTVVITDLHIAEAAECRLQAL